MTLGLWYRNFSVDEEGKLTIARRSCRTGVSMCSRTVTMATLKSSADTKLPPAPASSPKADRREEKRRKERGKL